MLLGQFIEISDVPDEGLVVELLYRCVACYDIHGLAAEEVYELGLDLCRASISVRTE